MRDDRTIEPGDILRDTTPYSVDGIEGRYSAFIPDAWRIFYAFGGSTMAVAMRAAVAELDREDLDLLSADATFCAAVPCGPVGVQVEVLRSGRSGAQALVRLWALDPTDPDATGEVGNDLVVTCVLGMRAETQYRFLGATPPEVTSPEQTDRRSEIDEDSPFSKIPYHAQTEFRPVGHLLKWGPDAEPGEPRSAAWFRFRVTPRRADGTWEPATLALPGDILGPAVHAGTGSKPGAFLVISLQISLQFVGPVRSEWLLQHTRAHVAADGYASGTAELWDEDMQLVAIATQCAKLQPIKPG